MDFRISVVLAAFLVNIHANATTNPELDFSFKGHRFGDVLKPMYKGDESLQPLEKIWLEIGSDTTYPKIKVRRENDDAAKFFGAERLKYIKYHYFDEKLYRITLEFNPSKDCNAIPEVIKLLELRYLISIKQIRSEGSQRYKGQYSNGKISMEVNCAKPFLDEISQTENNERVIEIEFVDIQAQEKSKIHILDEIKKKRQIDENARENKLKERINF